MYLSPFIAMFAAVFLAELGDKTQLAAMLFSAKGEHSPWVVFIIATLALTASTAIAVLLGAFASKYVEALPMKLLAGVGFLIIGSWTLWEHFKA
ncbi:MAG: TMEM165/GDT1 family protein [Alphaproteobacteria bacterium]|nr:TMEM165/GDT1 family protein [Alphaproteobacteria bacterium]